MSNTARIAATAANTLVKPLDVSDVFSTYLYTGNGTSQTITNGIDLSGEGGLMWFKRRDAIYSHHLYDTEVGVSSVRFSDLTNPDTTGRSDVTVNSNGFSVGSTNPVNANGSGFASWTFRKAPKFFDVVTYTGDGTTNHTIGHNLGSVPGCIMIKRTDTTGNWIVYHRGIASDAETDYLHLHLTAAAADWAGVWNDTAPTSTQFTVGDLSHVNASGGTFVAYLFAHNDGDGDFGPTGDQDIIKCGSYTGNASNSAGPTIDLGFEPQWVMIKSVDSAYDWFIADTMRGWTATHPKDDNLLRANSSSAETANTEIGLVNSTGFQIMGGGAEINGSGQTYIYIAIRRGPMAVPESATDVFDIATRGASSGEPNWKSGFVTDFAIIRNIDTADNWQSSARLIQGKSLIPNDTSAESSNSNYAFDYMNGFFSSTTTDSTFYSWMWKRAPNFFDVVAYTGTGSARTVSHNLGVAPEMIWVKGRSNVDNWSVYHKDLSSGQHLQLNATAAAGTNSNMFTTTAPTSSVFSLGSDGAVNGSSNNYIAYLFASLDGISKVGSYTGNGTNTGDAQNIDCGFSSGARFVLIKATSVAYGWMLFDTERGITSGNDSLLVLNDIDAETTAFDSVDPYSSGFTAVQGPYNVNQSGVEYIFYAIA